MIYVSNMTFNKTRHIQFSEEQLKEIESKSQELQISFSAVVRQASSIFCKGVSK